MQRSSEGRAIETNRYAAPRALPAIIALLVLLVLVGLPLAAWLDLRNITSGTLLKEAANMDSVVTGIRSFYADDVVARVLAANGHADVTAHFKDHPGGIPIPATFSLALGRVIGDSQATFRYRFISHYPFRGTPPHHFNAFENAALASLERNPHQALTSVVWDGMTSRVRYVTPIVMQAECVACHNASPDSPKHDWKVGDVRGIQELIVTQPIAYHLGDFRNLLIYFAFLAIVGYGALALQNRQTKFLASISERVSKYISPQIYRTIFSGVSSAPMETKRKKLTIFFSDIKDFTATSERLQPERLTALLNDYFTAMSEIALAHGGTVDKFVGDAILVFFGDPESRGEAEDAKACVRMALAMQQRVAALNGRWHAEGLESAIGVRMGINTGYCNVGNFGSAQRMDYTIIGAEVNLAARLQGIGEPGSIVLSYETYALVRDIVRARELAPIEVKGVSRPVVPYLVEGEVGAGAARTVFADREDGLELYLDVVAVKDRGAVRALLERALDALGES
jgi:adenylate cyclase